MRSKRIHFLSSVPSTMNITTHRNVRFIPHSPLFWGKCQARHSQSFATLSLGQRLKESSGLLSFFLPGGIPPVTVAEKCHEDAKCYKVIMMLGIEVVVVLMSQSPKPEDGYIWVYTKARLPRYQGYLGPDFLYK